MDISPKEWENELEPKDTELLAKIESKPYRAYEIVDLVSKTNDPLVAIGFALTLQTSLSRLVKKGLVKSKNIRGTTFYISPKAL
jgi:predicted transcriptional regulator